MRNEKIFERITENLRNVMVSKIRKIREPDAGQSVPRPAGERKTSGGFSHMAENVEVPIGLAPASPPDFIVDQTPKLFPPLS